MINMKKYNELKELIYNPMDDLSDPNALTQLFDSFEELLSYKTKYEESIIKIKSLEKYRDDNHLYHLLIEDRIIIKELRTELAEIKTKGCWNGTHKVPSNNGQYIDQITDKELSDLIQKNIKNKTVHSGQPL